jgi:hypothetical protein
MVGVNRSAGQNPSCESKSRLSGDKIVHVLQNPNIYYRFLNSPPTGPYPELDKSKINFNIILLSVSESPKGSLLKDIKNQVLYSFVISPFHVIIGFRYLTFE